MILHDNIKALCEMFLNGAANEIKVLFPYPAEEVEAQLVQLGWLKTNDSNGNAILLPERRDDDFDFSSWAAVAAEDSEDCYLTFGHL